MAVEYAYLIIDLGTTKTEVVLYDSSVRVLRSTSFRTRETVHDGYACIDPQACVLAVMNSIKELDVAGAGVRRVKIMATGMGSTLLACTPDGVVRYPAIAWHQAARTAMPPGLPTEGTGKVPIATYPVYKISTLKQAVPEEAAVFAALPDYVSAALSGFKTWVTDRTFASRSMMYSDRDHRWHGEILRALSIGADTLPTVVGSGETIGTVPPELRKNTHLPDEATVVTGMHDHAATLYAATQIRNALGIKALINAAGTTESAMELVPFCPEVVREAPVRGLNTQATWSTDALAVTSYPTLSGRFLELAESFAVPWDVDEAMVCPNVLAACPMRRLQPGDPGLIMPGRPGTFTVHDLWKALILSSQYELKTSVADIAAFGAQAPYKAVLLLGGQARNSRLRRLKSVVLGLPLYSGLHENFASFGAALLLSCRYGFDQGTTSRAAERSASALTVQYPDPELVRQARITYQRYISMLGETGVAPGATPQSTPQGVNKWPTLPPS